jgi:hypothetical protein
VAAALASPTFLATGLRAGRVIPSRAVAHPLATPGLADGQGFSRKADPTSQGHEMASTKFIEIDGKRMLWTDVLKLRRAQQEAAQARQPPLFEMREDARPPAERTAAGRFLEPTLLSYLRDRT